MLVLLRSAASSSSSSRRAPNSNSSTSRTRRCSMDVIRPCPLGMLSAPLYLGSPLSTLRPVLVNSHIRYKITAVSCDKWESTEIDDECKTVEY
jgi:hypothetical protein